MNARSLVAGIALAGVVLGGAVAFAEGPQPLVFRARVPAPAARGVARSTPPTRVRRHALPRLLTPAEERGVIAALGASLGGKTFHTDSYQMPFTIGVQQTQTTNNVILKNPWTLDMGGDTPSFGTTEHQVSAGFHYMQTDAGKAAVSSSSQFPSEGVELDVQIKNGTTYLFDCAVEAEKAAFATTELTSNQSGFHSGIVDQGVETVQHSHLLLTYVAANGDGWVQIRFTAVTDTPSPNAEWWFTSCKVTPLSSN